MDFTTKFNKTDILTMKEWKVQTRKRAHSLNITTNFLKRILRVIALQEIQTLRLANYLMEQTA